MNAVIDGMRELLTRLVGEDVRVVMWQSAPLPAVRADKAQLEQVIMNLVVNAKDAMPHGGSLTIETRRIELDVPNARLYSADTGAYVEIAVTDTGSGMDEATRQRMFEPFFTTKEVGKGTGLGLATVYGIVKQSHGGLLVETGKKGSTFRVALPVQAAHVEPAAELADPVSRAGTGTVLVVEDEESVRSLFVRVLRNAGYEVLQARHGVEALMVSQELSGEIDLVISDVIMPGMNGPEAVRHLVNARPALKVLYVSGYTRDVMLEHGLADAHARFMQKPVSPAALTAAVRTILDSAGHADEDAGFAVSA